MPTSAVGPAKAESEATLVQRCPLRGLEKVWPSEKPEGHVHFSAHSSQERRRILGRTPKWPLLAADALSRGARAESCDAELLAEERVGVEDRCERSAENVFVGLARAALTVHHAQLSSNIS